VEQGYAAPVGGSAARLTSTRAASTIAGVTDLRGLHDAIVTGDAGAAREITERALAADVDPLALVDEQMAPAMAEVGRRFEAGEYFVPELLLSARAMKGALELIRPLLAARGAEPVGRVAIGTVEGDLHDIGKNLVSSMLEGGGFEVVDLGVNVKPEQFVEAVTEKNVNVICLSALLTTTMLAMRRTLQALEDAGLRERVKVLVGGAPVTVKFAREIGADGSGENAVEAVAAARKALGLASV
jgi:corrinoid protein of di/trimethylamine methyltransferase